MERIEFEDIMNQYADSILRTCYLYLKDYQLAEEAMQETFIKFYECYESFRGESKLTTWLMRIAINTCKNYRQTSWFRRVIIGLEGVDERNAYKQVEAEIIKKDEATCILENVYQLNSKYREVILLFYYQEMKISEIASVLQLKEETVKTRLVRGRKKLKIIFEEEGINDGQYLQK